MPEWLSTLILTWLGPAGLAAIIGFIIWLVQHNILLIQHNKRLGVHDAEIKALEEASQKFDITFERINMTLEHVVANADKAERHIEEHNAEAEGWKRRIVSLETAVKNGKKL